MASTYIFNPIRTGKGGNIVPSLSRITVQIHVGACIKNLTSPNYEFKKGQCAFFPIKLSRFCERKNSVSQKCQNFITQGPLQTGSTGSRPKKYFKSQTLFLGVLGIQTSGILFESGKSFCNKSYPKRIGTLAPQTQDI